jgi:DNA-directed RNA polymerase specialized sigma subunit
MTANTTASDDLYTRVMQGDKAARDQMIAENMPLVLFKVSSYLGCFPGMEYLRDDIVGEGNVALVVAVDMIRDGRVTNSNIPGYISVSVQTAIGNFIDRELYSSDRTARRNRSAGAESEPMHKVSDSDHVIGELEIDPRKEADLLELIIGCCQTDEERAIVDLRVKGYVDAEIARQLDIPLTTTYMLRRELYQRVLATGEVAPD